MTQDVIMKGDKGVVMNPIVEHFKAYIDKELGP